MKRFIRAVVIAIILGASFAGALYLFLEARSARDMLVYMQGRKDGFNSCAARKTGGIIPPKGAIELTQHESGSVTTLRKRTSGKDT